MNQKRLPRWLVVAVVLVLIGAFGFSGYRVVTIYLAYQEAGDEYADLQALLNHGAATEPTQTPAPSAAATAAGTSERVVIVLAGPLPTPAPTEAATAAPTATPTPLIQMDFAPLLEINGDAVGWIYSEGTVIDYPIVQGDDNAFYLDHVFSGDWGFAGTLFMDVDNFADFSDMNTVVYGHHLNNGDMFASLVDYADQEYYDAHPVMVLYTPTGDYEIQIFSGYARAASAMPHDFDTPEDFMAYVGQITALSDFTTDVEVGPDDRVISLVTCSYVTDNARFVVHGKLVPLYAGDEE